MRSFRLNIVARICNSFLLLGFGRQVVYEDESPAADLTGLNDYYRMFKGEKGPRTITLITKDTKFYVQNDEKALDVVKRMICRTS